MKNRLKELRKVLGITQREVAERLEMDVGTVGKWECGLQDIPATRIYQICNEYNVRREWFERGEGEMFKPCKTEDELLQELATTLFKELSPKGQEIFMRVLTKQLEELKK